MRKREVRRKALLNILRERTVHSQAELQKYLKEKGFSVTQATLSRDIKQLGVVKTEKGYQVIEEVTHRLQPPASDVLKDMVVSVDMSHFIVVVRTLFGCAVPVAQAMERLELPGLLGSIPGTETVMVVFKSKETARICAQKIHSFISET